MRRVTSFAFVIALLAIVVDPVMAGRRHRCRGYSSCAPAACGNCETGCETPAAAPAPPAPGTAHAPSTTGRAYSYDPGMSAMPAPVSSEYRATPSYRSAPDAGWKIRGDFGNYR